MTEAKQEDYTEYWLREAFVHGFAAGRSRGTPYKKLGPVSESTAHRLFDIWYENLGRNDGLD